MGQVYEHVTPEMRQRVRYALEARWLGSVLELTDAERDKLLGWLPKLRPAVEEAQKLTLLSARETAQQGDGR